MPSGLAAMTIGPRVAGLSSWHGHNFRSPAFIGFAGVLAVLVSAPFEATRPLVRLPGQSITSLETVLLAAFGAAAWAVVRARSLPVWRTPLTGPGATVLIALTLAALLAPSDRANALHMVGRLTLAAGLVLLTTMAVTTAARGRTVMLVACATGAVTAALVALDFTRVPFGQQLLAPFRTQIATVGAQVRASGPFQYPTIASMFLEIAFACGSGLLALASERHRTREAAMLMAALLLIAAAIILTYTRAGLITMGSSLVIVAALQVCRGGVDRSLGRLGVLAAAIAVMIPLSRSTEAMRLRLTTEGQNGWYSARIDAPQRITMATGSRIEVPVTLTNIGQVTWDSSAVQPFGFSYHWLLRDSDRVVSWEGIRSSFSEPVRPGDRVTVRAQLEAPREPGDYRIVWDLYQEHLLWFSTEPDAELTMSNATVNGTWSGPARDPAQLPEMPKRVTRPNRGVLWAAAWRMLTERPWFGIGPDNFRLRYGPYAGLPQADPRVHTNNMYLELLVGGGLVAGAAIVWFSWRLLGLLLAAGRSSTRAEHGPAIAGVVAAVMAIALHGLVDSFLAFTATYAAMAITVGLLVSWGRMAHSHAHRV
jgi:O-Antigen ligase